MSQSYSLPASADTLAAARTKHNDAFGAVATWFSGATAPSSPFAYQRWLDTTNKWLWIRNAANTAWLPFSPLDAIGAPVFHLSKWVQHSDNGNNVAVGYLPANHIVLAATVRTTTLFNAGGADTIDVGYSGAASGYVAAADISATGTDAGAGPQIGVYSSTARSVVAVYTGAGGAPTTGKALVTIEAIIVPAQP